MNIKLSLSSNFNYLYAKIMENQCFEIGRTHSLGFYSYKGRLSKKHETINKGKMLEHSSHARKIILEKLC